MDDFDASMISTEKMIYGTFRRAFVSFRKAAIPKLITPFTDIELPNNSVLHTVGNFLNPEALEVDPDIQIPPIRNEQFPVFLKYQYDIPQEGPFAVTDKYRFIVSKYPILANSFFQRNKSIRKMMSVEGTLARQNVLSVYDYNSVLQTYLMGRMVSYRKFMILMSTILDSVTKIEGKHQYLLIPMSDTPYTRMNFLQPFQKITPTTLRIQNDMSYYFLLHFLGYLAKAPTSLFNKLDDFGPGLLDTFNVIITHGTGCIVYNLGDLKIINDIPTFYLSVLRHVNTLKLIALLDSTPEEIAEIAEGDFDEIVQRAALDSALVSKDEASPDTAGEGEPDDQAADAEDPTDPESEPAEAETPAQDPELTEAEIQKLLSEDDEALAEVPLADTEEQPFFDVTKDQQARVATLTDRYKTVELSGVNLETLLNTPPPAIDSNRLTFLEKDLPDPSMASSSIMDIDKLYVGKMMNKDIAAVLTAFSANGMFITDLQEKDEISQLNRIRTYKATFVDASGKSHTITFKYPIVSEEGTFLINGITNRMTKQQVNLPICKISSTRVNLSSNYNKTLIERVTTKANSYDTFINRYINALRLGNKITVQYGKGDTAAKVAYDYSCVGRVYSQIDSEFFTLTFDHENRYTAYNPGPIAKEDISDVANTRLPPYEKKYGVFLGQLKNRDLLFINTKNVLTVVKEAPDGSSTVVTVTRLLNFLDGYFSKDIPTPKMIGEWTELKIQDKNFPIIFVLGYRFGLNTILKELKHPYKFYPRGEKIVLTTNDIEVPFEDGSLVFNRYPLEKSLILSGLLRYKTRRYYMAEFDAIDGYFRLLTENKTSTNYLKGITSLFDLFVDPITRDILITMKEPTTVKGLLIRATQMLSTTDCIDSSSMANHRARGYERFPDILYNEMSRALAKYNSQTSPKRIFSINPEAVFQRIIQDPTVSSVDEINPMHDLKSKTAITYAGMGGRTAQSFVTKDRKYPDDGVGVLSECTPDSQKVAINAYMTADPIITNIRGMYDTAGVDLKKIPPGKVLSAAGLLMPGVTQDDGKRLNMYAIQLSHHVPCDYSETNRIRTGYEKVVAHRTSETFAYAAKADGVITKVDDALKVVRIQYSATPTPIDKEITLPISNATLLAHYTKSEPIYIIRGKKDIDLYKINTNLSINNTLYVTVAQAIMFTSIDNVPNSAKLPRSDYQALKQESEIYYIKLDPIPKTMPGDIDVVEFGNKYTPVSGSYLRQPIVLNVKEGDKVLRGDIVAYNGGFFEPDPDSKQVTWKHGVMANVTLIDKSITHEDSCSISERLSKDLEMHPAHVRPIVIKSSTVIHSIVNIGDHVQTTDLLCVIEDADIDILSLSDDPETVEFLAELNRKAPKAKYFGNIVDINMYYSCDIEKMHPSVAKVARSVLLRQAKLAEISSGTKSEYKFPPPQAVPIGTKFSGVEFEEDTVLIMITISEGIPCETGSKLVVMSANKSVTGSVMVKPTYTESGVPVDVLYGGSGIQNRIVNSPMIIGVGNRVLKKTEDDVLAMYFG